MEAERQAGACPLCGSAVALREFPDFLDVKCAPCGDFIMTRAAAEQIGGDGLVRSELARQTRWITKSGGRAFLGSDSVEAARKRVGDEIAN
jgi:hypothetical protein